MNRVGIWLEVPSEAPVPAELSRLVFLATRTFKKDGRILLEVATAAPSLHRQFYHFAVAVAERVIVENISAIDAIVLELRCFTDLLEEKSLLGVERQIGILGELIFLQRLIKNMGLGALDSWLGPIGEPHDFRVRDREFEVKTTISPHRIHTIHGTEQLVPSKSCSLYLVSVLLGPSGAGTGFSLVDKVVQLSDEFAPSAVRLNQFATALRACGFRDEDRANYTRAFSIRRPIAIAPVDENFPAITRSTIQQALGALAPRIESLDYDVSIEGLEREDGTEEFDAAIR
jgi:hypothetical protein